jgi:hypothetical protein
MPVVLIEGEGGTYWQKWIDFVERELLQNGWISQPDLSIVSFAKTPEEARDIVLHGYRVYHSSRTVRDQFVIRLKQPISEAQRADLETRFGRLAKDGRFVLSEPLEGEEEHLDLPRLHFTFVRRDFGVLMQLISAVNDCAAAP